MSEEAAKSLNDAFAAKALPPTILENFDACYAVRKSDSTFSVFFVSNFVTDLFDHESLEKVDVSEVPYETILEHGYFCVGIEYDQDEFQNLFVKPEAISFVGFKNYEEHVEKDEQADIIFDFADEHYKLMRPRPDSSFDRLPLLKETHIATGVYDSNGDCDAGYFSKKKLTEDILDGELTRENFETGEFERICEILGIDPENPTATPAETLEAEAK